MKRRSIVRIVVFVTAAIAVLLGYAVKFSFEKNQCKNMITRTYAQNFSALDTSVCNICDLLLKESYANGTAELCDLSLEICKETQSAKTALAVLPRQGANLSKIDKFLSQTGEYCKSISRSAICGEAVNEEQSKNIEKLLSVAVSVKQALERTGANLLSQNDWNKGFSTANINDSLIDGLSSGQEEITDYPTLIYDGPFSDNIYTKKSKMLENAEEISEKEARTRAVKVLGCNKNDVKKALDEFGKTPAYCYECKDSRVAITKNGGYLLYFRNNKKTGKRKLSDSELTDIAAKYIETLPGDFDHSFKTSYFFTSEGVCTVNFAYFCDGVTYYTDLIKIGVAVDDGQVVMCESRGFIMNHTKRNVEQPKISLESAANGINKKLTVSSIKRTVIPTKGDGEKPCYEVTCRNKAGKDVLIYINEKNGQEEEILLVEKTDGGTLVR